MKSIKHNSITPEYKMISVYRPHCPKCGQRLTGHNSIVMPYKCACGTWEYSVVDLSFNIVVDPKPKTCF